MTALLLLPRRLWRRIVGRCRVCGLPNYGITAHRPEDHASAGFVTGRDKRFKRFKQ